MHIRVAPGAQTPLKLSVVWSIDRADEAVIPVTTKVHVVHCNESAWCVLEGLAVEGSSVLLLRLPAGDGARARLDPLAILLVWIRQELHTGVGEFSVGPRIDLDVERVVVDVHGINPQGHKVPVVDSELLEPTENLGGRGETLTEEHVPSIISERRLRCVIAVQHACLQVKVVGKGHPTAADTVSETAIEGHVLNIESIPTNVCRVYRNGTVPVTFDIEVVEPKEKLWRRRISLRKFDGSH